MEVEHTQSPDMEQPECRTRRRTAYATMGLESVRGHPPGMEDATAVVPHFHRVHALDGRRSRGGDRRPTMTMAVPRPLTTTGTAFTPWTRRPDDLPELQEAVGHDKYCRVRAHLGLAHVRAWCRMHLLTHMLLPLLSYAGQGHLPPPGCVHQASSDNIIQDAK